MLDDSELKECEEYLISTGILYETDDNQSLLDDPEYMYEMGYDFVNHGDGKHAVYCYTKSAELGYLYAQFNLAALYYFGEIIEINYDEAIYWFKKAYETDSTEEWAPYYLGEIYANGKGVDVDLDVAIDWYRKAALNGHKDAPLILKKYGVNISDEEIAAYQDTIKKNDSEDIDVNKPVINSNSGIEGGICWELDNDGVLIISPANEKTEEGYTNGEMKNYEYPDIIAPWQTPEKTPYQLVINEGVTKIGNSAFCDCSEIEGELTLPTSTTNIGKFAFAYCTGFSGQLIIPENVSVIEEGAFKRCEDFDELVLSDGLKTIGDEAFSCCRFRGTIIIPDSVIDIGERIFEYCILDDFILPSNCTKISNGMFAECSALFGPLNIPENIVEIGDDAFRGCNNLCAPLSLPNSIKIIGNHAFADCIELSGSLTIPDSVTIIGDGAFENCKGLDGSLILSKSLLKIGKRAFANCEGFTGSLTIPDSVKEIDDGAFWGCSEFSEITCPEGATIHERAFYVTAIDPRMCRYK